MEFTTKTMELKHTLESKLDEAKHIVRHAQRQLDETIDQAKLQIKRNPLTSVSVGVGVGIGIGMLTMYLINRDQS